MRGLEPLTSDVSDRCSQPIELHKHDGPIPQLSPARADTGLEVVEGTGFEPVDRFNPIRSLANCWFKPLTQPSKLVNVGGE